MAGLDLHRLIIEQKETSGRDQDHLRVLHASFSDMILDRTEALQQGHPEIPAKGMADVLISAETTGDALGMHGVAVVPCNTFHAPAIWDLFTAMMKERGSRLTILHMVHITISWLKQRYPEIRKIGLISTRGTRKARIYADPCEKEGIEIVNSVDQESIDQAIYDPDWGIKAVTPVSASARATILDQIEQMQILGVQAVILGCTEIPLAVPETVYHGLPLINPLSILADALITYVNSHNNT